MRAPIRAAGHVHHPRRKSTCLLACLPACLHPPPSFSPRPRVSPTTPTLPATWRSTVQATVRGQWARGHWASHADPITLNPCVAGSHRVLFDAVCEYVYALPALPCLGLYHAQARLCHASGGPPGKGSCSLWNIDAVQHEMTVTHEAEYQHRGYYDSAANLDSPFRLGHNPVTQEHGHLQAVSGRPDSASNA